MKLIILAFIHIYIKLKCFKFFQKIFSIKSRNTKNLLKILQIKTKFLKFGKKERKQKLIKSTNNSQNNKTQANKKKQTKCSLKLAILKISKNSFSAYFIFNHLAFKIFLKLQRKKYIHK